MSSTYISRFPYGWFAVTDQEKKQLKDFLGIFPAGADIDTYLSGLTQKKLDDWNDYWVDIWNGLGRKDLRKFTRDKFDEYSKKLKAEVKKKEEVKPVKVKPSVAEIPSNYTGKLKEMCTALRNGIISKNAGAIRSAVKALLTTEV